MDDLTQASLVSAFDAALDLANHSGGISFKSTYDRDCCREHFTGLVERLDLQHPHVFNSLAKKVSRLAGNVRKHVYESAKDCGNPVNIDRFVDALQRRITEELRFELI